MNKMSQEAAAKRRKTDDSTMAPDEGDGDSTAAISSDVMSNMLKQQMLQMKNEMNQQLLAMKADQQTDLRMLKMENDMNMEKYNAALLKNDLEQQIIQLKRDINERKMSENDMKISMNEQKIEMNEQHVRILTTQQHNIELQNQVHTLTAKCRSLERTAKLLTASKNEKWEYKVPEIPSDYWLNLGITDEDDDEDYCLRVNKLTTVMKEKTCALRRGGYIYDLRLSIKDMTVFHDDIMLPHWNQLADALQLSTYSDAPISIEISHVELANEVLDLLESAFSTKSFREFSLDGNRGGNSKSIQK